MEAATLASSGLSCWNCHCCSSARILHSGKPTKILCRNHVLDVVWLLLVGSCYLRAVPARTMAFTPSVTKGALLDQAAEVRLQNGQDDLLHQQPMSVCLSLSTSTEQLLQTPPLGTWANPCASRAAQLLGGIIQGLSALCCLPPFVSLNASALWHLLLLDKKNYLQWR